MADAEDPARLVDALVSSADALRYLWLHCPFGGPAWPCRRKFAWAREDERGSEALALMLNARRW